MIPSLKRVLKVGGAVLALLVAVPAAMVGSAFLGIEPLPETADLPGGARLVKDGIVASFVLPAGPGAFALVDCGNDVSGKLLLAELSRRGATPEAVKAVFLTHGHPDHTAGCHLFPKAEIYALAADQDLAAGKAGSKGPLTAIAGLFHDDAKAIKVTRALLDGDTQAVGELSVQAFAVPGHTAGSAAYLANGVLYLGDSAGHLKDGGLAGAPWAFSDSTAQNHASLRGLWKRLKATGAQVTTLAFAHSAPASPSTLEAFAARSD